VAALSQWATRARASTSAERVSRSCSARTSVPAASPGAMSGAAGPARRCATGSELSGRGPADDGPPRCHPVPGPWSECSSRPKGASSSNSPSKVSVTAGASAPEHLVGELVEALQAMGYSELEEMDIVEEDVRFQLPQELSGGMVSAASIQPAS